MNEKEIAWVAGLFEGEGCVTINYHRKNGLPYVRVSLGMTDADVIEKLHQIVGAGTIDYNKVRPNRTKRMICWRLGKRYETLNFLSAIAPEMGIRRRAKIEEAITIIVEQMKPIHCLGCEALCLNSPNRKYCTRNCGRRYQKCLAQELDLVRSGI